MLKSMRKVMAVIGAVALVVALLATMAGNTFAANLTGGQYTYLINGEETTFAYDPVQTKNGVLLPVEVFQQFGLNVDGALTRTVTLTKGEDVRAVATLGTTTAVVNGRAISVSTAPLRLNGRLFLPSDLLQSFGVDVSLDGQMVVMRNYMQGMPMVKHVADEDFNGLQLGRKFDSTAKADTGIYLNGTWTLLTTDMLSANNLDISYGTRARLLNMIQTNTLVMVKVSNNAFKAGGLVTTNVSLVDDQRNQYDLLNVMDIGNGLVSNKLAPGADRVGVLVFPKVSGTAQTLSLYYDASGQFLNTFTKAN